MLNGSPNGKTEPNVSPQVHPNGDQRGASRLAPPTFYGHNKEEVIRIVIQGLIDLGYNDAANALSQESGCSLETPYASAFRLAIMEGEWSEAELLLSSTLLYDEGGGVELGGSGSTRLASRNSWDSQRTLSGMALSETADKDEMLFLIRQQKYLELLEVRDLGAALMVLRQELQPIHHDERQLHALSRYCGLNFHVEIRTDSMIV